MIYNHVIVIKTMPVQKLNQKWSKKILAISCACYKDYNAFKTTIKRNNGLGTISNYIHNLSNQSRTIAKEIGATCPKHNNTW